MKSLYKLFAGTLVGIVLLSLFSSWLYDNLKTVPVAGPVFGWLKDAAAAAASFFEYKIPIWTFLVAIASILLLLFIMSRISVQRVPKHVSYTSDRFKDWIWRWQYNNNYAAINLSPYCPDCDVRLVTSGIQSYDSIWDAKAICPSCQREWIHRDKHNSRSKFTAYGQEPSRPVEYIDEIIPLVEKGIRDHS